jgi:hypothetical protein
VGKIAGAGRLVGFDALPEEDEGRIIRFFDRGH